MVDPKKLNSALYALHLLTVQARLMAQQGEAYEAIAALLDYAEMLPRLIASGEDETERFRAYLAEVAGLRPACALALRRFDESFAGFPW